MSVFKSYILKDKKIEKNQPCNGKYNLIALRKEL